MNPFSKREKENFPKLPPLSDSDGEIEIFDDEDDGNDSNDNGDENKIDWSIDTISQLKPTDIDINSPSNKLESNFVSDFSERDDDDDYFANTKFTRTPQHVIEGEKNQKLQLGMPNKLLYPESDSLSEASEDDDKHQKDENKMRELPLIQEVEDLDSPLNDMHILDDDDDDSLTETPSYKPEFSPKPNSIPTMFQTPQKQTALPPIFSPSKTPPTMAKPPPFTSPNLTPITKVETAHKPQETTPKQTFSREFENPKVVVSSPSNFASNSNSNIHMYNNNNPNNNDNNHTQKENTPTQKKEEDEKPTTHTPPSRSLNFSSSPSPLMTPTFPSLNLTENITPIATTTQQQKPDTVKSNGISLQQYDDFEEGEIPNYSLISPHSTPLKQRFPIDFDSLDISPIRKTQTPPPNSPYSFSMMKNRGTITSIPNIPKLTIDSFTQTEDEFFEEERIINERQNYSESSIKILQSSQNFSRESPSHNNNNSFNSSTRTHRPNLSLSLSSSTSPKVTTFSLSSTPITQLHNSEPLSLSHSSNYFTPNPSSRLHTTYLHHSTSSLFDKNHPFTKYHSTQKPFPLYLPTYSKVLKKQSSGL